MVYVERGFLGCNGELEIEFLDILCRLYVDYPVQSDRGFVCGALLQILRNELKDAAVVPDCRTFE